MTLTPYPTVYVPKQWTPQGIICDAQTYQVITVSGKYGGWSTGKGMLVPFEQLSALLNNWEKDKLRWLEDHQNGYYQQQVLKVYRSALNRHKRKLIAQAMKVADASGSPVQETVKAKR